MMKGALAKLALALCLGAAALTANADTGATNNVVTTNSGLQYVDLAAGNGSTVIGGDVVVVHYTGWLQNPDGSRGRMFDTSRDRGEPFTFMVGAHQVIRGWDEGVQGMKVGGQRRLIVPAALGYGARGAGGGLIPPNANLIFDVELLKIRQ